MPFRFSGLARSAAVGVVSSFATTFAHRFVVFVPAVATPSGFFPASVNFVDRRPGPALGFVLGYAAAFVAFFNVLSLSFFFVGVFGFVSAWHRPLLMIYESVQTAYRQSLISRVAMARSDCHFLFG